MPTSYPHHLHRMVEWIVRLRPSSVLDVGVGFGKWGFLAREFLDVAAGRYGPESWQVRIEGVEVFPEYATPVYDYVYDAVHFGDALAVVPRLGSYDLAVLGDVIEHLAKDDGRRLLDLLRARTRFVLLSSPTEFFEQEAYGNPHERHLSLWTADDLAPYEFDYDEYENVFVAVLRGELAGEHDLALRSWPARAVYSRSWLRSRQQLAHVVKARLAR